MKNLKFLVAALAFAALFTACNKDGELLKNEYLIDGVNYKVKSVGVEIREESEGNRHWFALAPDKISDGFLGEPDRYITINIPSSLLGEVINLKTITAEWYYINIVGHSNINEIGIADYNRDHLVSGTLLISKEGDKYTITFAIKVMKDEREVEVSLHYSGTPEMIVSLPQ